MFSAKRDLQLHEMRHHSKERPHVCPTCQKGKNIKISYSQNKKLNNMPIYINQQDSSTRLI